MKFLLSFAVLGLLVLFSSCARQEPAPAASAETGRHATVVLRDGSKAAGTVTASSATQITLAGDDHITRTIPMDQVRSIEYGDTAAAPAPASAPAPAAAPAPAPAARRAAPPAPAREGVRPAPVAAVTTRTHEVPVGAEVAVRTNETIDSAKAVEGQTFAADVTRDVRDANGDVVIPRGANADIVIKSASKGGRFRGASDLVLDLKSVTIGGRRYAVETADISRQGKSGIGANKRTAEYTGGGAALGALIGAIAGGGKGAAIGAGAGAGAGAITQIVTKGRSIKVPVESILTFKLDQPLRVTEAR